MVISCFSRLHRSALSDDFVRGATTATSCNCQLSRSLHCITFSQFYIFDVPIKIVAIVACLNKIANILFFFVVVSSSIHSMEQSHVCRTLWAAFGRNFNWMCAFCARSRWVLAFISCHCSGHVVDIIINSKKILKWSSVLCLLLLPEPSDIVCNGWIENCQLVYLVAALGACRWVSGTILQLRRKADLISLLSGRCMAARTPKRDAPFCSHVKLNRIGDIHVSGHFTLSSTHTHTQTYDRRTSNVERAPRNMRVFRNFRCKHNGRACKSR